MIWANSYQRLLPKQTTRKSNCFFFVCAFRKVHTVIPWVTVTNCTHTPMTGSNHSFCTCHRWVHIMVLQIMVTEVHPWTTILNVNASCVSVTELALLELLRSNRACTPVPCRATDGHLTKQFPLVYFTTTDCKCHLVVWLTLASCSS